ncbi:MAG: glycoside hydrolase family 15 protein [Thermoanaerobaculia bacterium]
MATAVDERVRQRFASVAPTAYPPISDYALIGDSRSSALVSSSGSIDWCCWPRFDSPSVFARILDWEEGGYFRITPTSTFRTSRRYLEATNILETTFHTEGGKATLTDLMPALSGDEKRRILVPFREIVRRVEGVDGEVQLRMDFVPRPKYSRSGVRLKKRSAFDVAASTPGELLDLRATVPLELEQGRASATFVLKRRERQYFSISYSNEGPAVLPSVGERAEEILRLSTDFWRKWSGHLEYSGPYRDLVVRSALVLKLLTYAPSGAIIAAPTTSLPEAIGSHRNWDYRYCWLRDASFTARALYDLGFHVEAEAYVQWLLQATHLTQPELQVLYSVYGESHLPERELEDFDGYRNSRPVRVGNGAHGQFQLDVYGEVMMAMERFESEGRRIDKDTRKLLVGIAEYVCDHWDEPDSGIWEIRGASVQHTHGKAMAWAALDSAIRLAERLDVSGNLPKWKRVREEIRNTVMEKGYNRQLQSFTRGLDDDKLDGSLLTLPLIGFIDGDHPKMQSTIDLIRKRLGRGELVYRYVNIDDGIGGAEGAFLACSFWLVSALARAGRMEEAHQTFDALASRANDVGLYSEEIDPDTGLFVGNFPQGLTHIALINAALNLSDEEAKRRRGGA